METSFKVADNTFPAALYIRTIFLSATISLSNNCPIIDEHIVIIFEAQKFRNRIIC